MKKEEIAKKNLQEYEGLGRSFKVQDMYFDPSIYAEGNIITSKEAKSFAGQSSDEEFQVETSFDGPTVTIVFNCDNKVLAHKVDYQDKNEVDTLCAVESEDEYLVPAGTHFEITFSSTKDDLDEMGYFEVDIEQIDDQEYQDKIKEGAREVYDI
ncbi:hypothetical protein [Lactobacillus intestinalis]|uniref:hypothetical protein n=1 Tax=Lactobacillus intestinalis TaxID=151781 RepID=UPI00272B75EF|nr:hypothetical protein [Lactobacillus intestinalis]